MEASYITSENGQSKKSLTDQEDAVTSGTVTITLTAEDAGDLLAITKADENNEGHHKCLACLCRPHSSPDRARPCRENTMTDFAQIYCDGAAVAYRDVAAKLRQMVVDAPIETKDVMEAFRPFADICEEKAKKVFKERERFSNRVQQ